MYVREGALVCVRVYVFMISCEWCGRLEELIGVRRCGIKNEPVTAINGACEQVYVWMCFQSFHSLCHCLSANPLPYSSLSVALDACIPSHTTII